MTDNELAEELEFHAKHGISAAPALQHEASERIHALSAHVALLKASLAQAERESEKATASAEPFGYFRVTPFGWEDCAETDDGSIPLYTAPQAERVAELAAEVERLRAGSHRRAVRGGCRSVCAQGKGGRPMLTRGQVTEVILDWMERIQEAEGQINAIGERFGEIDYYAPLPAAVAALAGGYTKAASKIVGDEDDWLEFFWIDCALGANPLGVIPEKGAAEIKIDGPEALAQVIYWDREHGEAAR